MKGKKKSLVGWVDKDWRGEMSNQFLPTCVNLPTIHKNKFYAPQKVRITIEELQPTEH